MKRKPNKIAKKTPRRRQAAPEIGFWKPSERNIFRYWDGQKEVAADPVLLSQEFAKVEGFDKDCKIAATLYESGDQSEMALKSANASFGRVVETVRRVFGLKPLSEGGLLQDEVITTLLLFTEFMDGLKKKAGILPTSVPSMAGPAEGSPIHNSSVSGPMLAASSEGIPILSLSDLPEPSREMRPGWWGQQSMPPSPEPVATS